MNAMQKPVKPRGAPLQSPRGGTVMQDGSYVVTAEQLARFGGGDAAVGRRELRLLLELDSDTNTADTKPTERPLSVRVAGPPDEPALLELWLQDLRANADHIATIDEAKVLENIRAGTRNRGNGHVVCIDGPDGSPVAMLVLHALEWHWSRGRYWQEMCSYVHVDHRRSHHADDLMNYAKWAAENMSRQMGTRFYLLCGVLGAWRVRPKIALYRRKFHQQVGAAFIWPPAPMRGN